MTPVNDFVATGLTIGHVAEATGVAATTLRYCEQIGLVPVPARVGGQRRYDESVLARECEAAGALASECEASVTLVNHPPAGSL